MPRNFSNEKEQTMKQIEIKLASCRNRKQQTVVQPYYTDDE